MTHPIGCAWASLFRSGSMPVHHYKSAQIMAIHLIQGGSHTGSRVCGDAVSNGRSRQATLRFGYFSEVHSEL